MADKAKLNINANFKIIKKEKDKNGNLVTKRVDYYGTKRKNNKSN